MCFLGRFVPWRGLGVCFKPGQDFLQALRKVGATLPKYESKPLVNANLPEVKEDKAVVGQQPKFLLGF